MSPKRPDRPAFRAHLAALAFVVLASFLSPPPAQAACPPGDNNPITSGDPAAGPLVVLAGLGPAPGGSFFLSGSGDLNQSGALPGSAWLHRTSDLDGDGLPEIRIDAPGEGPGGWGDPRVLGCPSDASPSHPPLVLFVRHDPEDLDGDGKFDVFEDRDRQGDLDPGEDLDGDGRLTPLPVKGVGGGCEGLLREDIDCDGRLDKITEDLDGDGVLDPGEDRDRDGHLDRINEDRNNNNILDDRVDPAVYNDLIPDETGAFGTFYPYMSARPAPGGFRIVAISWDGRAYNLQATSVATTPAQDARLLQALALPAAPQAGDCPRSGLAGQPIVDIASINRLPSGSLDARVSISDPDGDPLSGLVEIGAPMVAPDLRVGGTDLCDGPLLPEDVAGQGALYAGSADLTPSLVDLDSVTGCQDGRADFGFTYGTCAASSGAAPRAVLALSCQDAFPICVRRLDGRADFDYIVRHVDPQGLSITSAALPPVAFTSGRPPRSLDLRDLGAAGPYVLTITADDGETPVARDSMSFDWSGERTLYFNHRKAADRPADGRQE